LNLTNLSRAGKGIKLVTEDSEHWGGSLGRKGPWWIAGVDQVGKEENTGLPRLFRGGSFALPLLSPP
jgi:hypothetical protein